MRANNITIFPISPVAQYFFPENPLPCQQQSPAITGLPSLVSYPT